MLVWFEAVPSFLNAFPAEERFPFTPQKVLNTLFVPQFIQHGPGSLDLFASSLHFPVIWFHSAMELFIKPQLQFRNR